MISTGYILQKEEMNNLIEKMLVQRNQGNTELAQIEAQLVSVRNILDATDDQIHTTEANLDDVEKVSFKKHAVILDGQGIEATAEKRGKRRERGPQRGA